MECLRTCPRSHSLVQKLGALYLTLVEPFHCGPVSAFFWSRFGPGFSDLSLFVENSVFENLKPECQVQKPLGKPHPRTRSSDDACRREPALVTGANFSARRCCYSVTQPCWTLCNPMDCSTPGLPVLHQLPELAQTHVHCVGDATQPSHPLPSPSPAFNLSQHQGLFQQLTSIQASQDRLIHSLKEVKRKGTCSLLGRQ